MSTEELDDYRHYDRKTLEAFAASGDLKAIELLFDQELKNENENHLASYYARKGAIFGSTIGISRLIIFLHPDGILSREQNQYNFYEALALCKTLELRGDKLLSAQETSNFIKGYEKYARNKISLTSEEQQKINQRAQEIYDEWQAERHKFGIGDFDNSRPAGVDKLFDSKSLSQG
jgi:dissimilatory sulfite reductase (desulfoviridin) alpha/beta subunit